MPYGSHFTRDGISCESCNARDGISCESPVVDDAISGLSSRIFAQVIAPLLALLLGDGERLVVEVVPASLLHFSRSVLWRVFSMAIMTKPIFSFEAERAIPMQVILATPCAATSDEVDEYKECEGGFIHASMRQ